MQPALGRGTGFKGGAIMRRTELIVMAGLLLGASGCRTPLEDFEPPGIVGEGRYQAGQSIEPRVYDIPRLEAITVDGDSSDWGEESNGRSGFVRVQ